MNVGTRVVVSIICGTAACAAIIATGCCREPTSPITESSIPFKSTAFGCAAASVHLESADGHFFLNVNAMRDSLGLTTPRTFDLSVPTAGLMVTIDHWSIRPTIVPYCNDVISSNVPPPTIYHAVRGSVTISLSADNAPINSPFRTSVVLRGVVFRDQDGEEITVTWLAMRDVAVGFLPG